MAYAYTLKLSNLGDTVRYRIKLPSGVGLSSSVITSTVSCTITPYKKH